MAEETQIIPPENAGPVPDEPLNAETLIAAGEALSKSMMFALRRDYLDHPVFDEKFVQLLPETPPQQQDIAFLELEQVGKPVSESPGEYLKAIQVSLAASHDPRYRLIFIISSDGLRNKIFIGVSARTGGTQPRIFAAQLGQFLSSNWPGTRVKVVEEYKRIVENVHVPLSTYRYARAFTGIPSAKTRSQSNEYPHSLDRFMRGLRGKPYIYMVLAEPVPERSVGEIVSNCQTLAGQVHAFTKSTIQRSQSSGLSESTTKTEGETTTEGTTEGTNLSKSDTKTKGVLGTTLDNSSGLGKGLKAAGVAGVSGLLLATGGPFLLSGMLGMFGQLLPSTGTSESTGASSSTSESTSSSSSLSSGESTSSSESLSFGQEYLNKHAEACIKLLDKTAERFETARAEGCWNVGVYLISNQDEAATQAQAQFKALVSGEKSTAEPIRFHNLGKLWDGQIQVSLDAFQHPPLRLFAPQDGNRLHHPLGEAFENLTTPMNTEELSLLANLPLREVPGMPMQPAAYFSLNPPAPNTDTPGLQLGQILEGGEIIGDLNYEIDTDTLTRHIFITGITGSGKSNTCRRLIEQLMDQGKNFLVIEPAKDEYVRLALAYNKTNTFNRKIAVYAPGRTHLGNDPLEQLRLNPFDIVRLPGVTAQVMPHLDRLKSIFNASFPMYEILPVILEEALVDLYSSQGWLEDQLPPDEVQCPTLSQMHDRLTGLIRSKGYEERITANITAAMKTRISSLMRGWKGKLFDLPDSTPWSELFDRPVVINLQQMGDDADKCFTMAMLLNFLYEYRQAQHEVEGSPESSELRHLAIIEEAHRILRRATSSAGEANPQAKMGDMFSDILAEIRAYGQGLAIVDQVPAKLVPDAIKNTNLKIIHRLVASDDRDAMASAMALTDDQAKVIARLKVGQAIVSGIQDDMASWVRINYSPIPLIEKKAKKN
ncbi:MAG: ATP-binding protein [Anaerolineales bacterium]|nr:ATP-binding protein [Anaerolineales bacterium]